MGSTINNETLYWKAGIALELGKVAEAKALYEKILSDNFEFAEVHDALGWLYYNEINAPEKAEYHYRFALKHRPNYRETYFNYSRLLVDFRRFDEAIQLIDRGLKIGGTNRADLFRLKALIEEAKFNWRDAMRYLKRARWEALSIALIRKIDQQIDRVKMKMPLVDRVKILF